MASPDHSWRPYAAALAGLALFSAMDVAMKSASIAVGAYSAYLLRCLVGFAMIAPVWWFQRAGWPSQATLRVHMLRGVVVAFMGLTFFYGLVRLPLAEAIALSFISPLIALYLAALLLGEKIHARAIFAAAAGVAGVTVIIAGKIGQEQMSDDAAAGVIAVLTSAVLYAWNLILQRQQALVANPSEISTFQNGIVALVLLPAAPFLLVIPGKEAWIDITIGAALAVGAALMLAWAYARAEAQALVPLEYSVFLWAALFGWLFFAEPVTAPTIVGAVLIVLGCWVAAHRQSPVAGDRPL